MTIRASRFHIGLAAFIMLINVLTVPIYFHTARAQSTDLIQHQDFLALYTGAQLPGPQLYDLDSQRQVQKQILGKPFHVPSGVLPFFSPPVYVPLVCLVTSDDYLQSYWRWMIFLIFVCLLCGVMVYLISKSWLAAVTAVLFYPLFNSLLKGQISPLLALGVLMWGYFLVRGQSRCAGAALCLLLAKPHLAIALAIPTLFANRKAFLTFALISTIAVAGTLVFVGMQGAKDLLHLANVLVTMNGDEYGIHSVGQFNVLGLLLKAGVSGRVAQLVAWSAFGAGVATSSYLLRGKTDLSRLGIVVVIALLTATHLQFYDHALLLLPMSAISERTKAKAFSFVPASWAFLYNTSRAFPFALLLILAVRCAFSARLRAPVA